MKIWEYVSIVFLGLFSMGNIDELADSFTNIGAYGTSTSSAGELFFFMMVFLLVATLTIAYLKS